MNNSEKESFLKSVNPLAMDKTVRIRFIHPADQKEHIFCSTVNRLSGNRLSWFDGEAPTVDDKSGSWAKAVSRNLYKKSGRILSHESCGGFYPPKEEA